MFDLSREELFRYDANQALEDAPLDEQYLKAFLQQVITRGARGGTEEAKDYVKEKAEEDDVLDYETRNQLLDLIDRYSKYR